MACPFCDLIASGHVLVDGGAAVAIADAFPLNPGHTLVVPRRHEPNFLALRPDELEVIARVARGAVEELTRGHHPDGWNLGVNVGDAAGQTIDHAHLHLVPRYRGDVDDPRGGVRWLIPARAPYWRGE